MSSTNPPSPAGSASSKTTTSGQNEDDLRKQLRAALHSLNRREPLEPTYKSLLSSNAVTTRRPILPKDKFYRRVGSRLRERVEDFMNMTQGKDPFDRLLQRQPLEEAAMRAALTLREAKEHEQKPLLEATLASMPRRNGMEESEWRNHLEGIALGLLQSRKANKKRARSPLSLAEQTETARQQAELDRQRSLARARETARRKREEEDRQRREDEIKRRRNAVDSPKQALHKLYQPIFKKLWDMEFATLGGTNPFRIVIDKDNCAAMGAPDYCDVIDKPMNLSYIRDKVNNMEYETLQAFCDDVNLMINNALIYNSDPLNPYRLAAEEMKKKHLKMVKKVVLTLKRNSA